MRGATLPLILGLEKAGATHIEVGIPFSDPIADGPTIQRSSYVALNNGATIANILHTVKDARRQTSMPILLMGYVNPILRYGVERFLNEAREAGVDGTIVPDLLPEESEEWRRLSAQYAISNVFLVAPTTSESRMRHLDAISSDFSYCVSVTGVTGARQAFGDANTFESFLKKVKRNTTKPFVVGFGISKSEQVRDVCRYADGVVVGSALIKAMENEKSIDGAEKAAARFFSSLAESS